MKKLERSEVREILEGAVDPEPGSWLVGVTLVLRDSQAIEGRVKRIEDQEVVMETDAGQRRAQIEEIENVLMHFQSQGPE